MVCTVGPEPVDCCVGWVMGVLAKEFDLFEGPGVFELLPEPPLLLLLEDVVLELAELRGRDLGPGLLGEGGTGGYDNTNKTPEKTL